MCRKFTLTRDLEGTDVVCESAVGLKKGDIVYEYSDCTYGCITSGGVAVAKSDDEDEPFFEVPADAVKEIPCQKK